MAIQSSRARRYWLGGKRADEQDRFFREALEARGWCAGDAEDWQAGWYTGTPDRVQFRKLSPTCKFNHLPGNNALTLKSRLYQSLAALRERMSVRFGANSPQVARLDFFPRSYLMPDDYHALQETALADPEQRWILKPSNASKGKGIRLLDDVAEAPRQAHWLVQEYLDDPHTIRGHKYVLRLYVLLASLDPLRLYVFRQGFAKLASAPYDRDDTANLFSQLTNPDINTRNTDAEVPVEFIDLERYRAWLREQGHDDDALFARLHDQLTLTVIAALDTFRQRCDDEGVDARGGYELLGIDCLIDADLKPWVLECNLSPSLGVCAGPESGGILEESIKRQLVEDMVSLVDLDGQEVPAASDASPRALLDDTRRELARAGDFLRLYPSADPVDHLAFFTWPSRLDWHLAKALTASPLPEPRLQRGDVCELIDDDRLALYDTRRGDMCLLNDSAALIWLLASEGETPSSIVERLFDASQAGHAPPDRDALEGHVWHCLADWCRQGFLQQAPVNADEYRQTSRQAPDTAARDASPSAASTPLGFSLAEHTWALHTDSAPALDRLAGALTLLDAEQGRTLPRLRLIGESGGYRIMLDDILLASHLGLAELGPCLVDRLARRTLDEQQLMIDAALLVHPEAPEEAVLVAVADDAWLTLREEAEATGYSLVRGLAWQRQVPGQASALGLPLALEGGRLAATPSPSPATLRIVGATKYDDDTAQPAPLTLLAALLPACRRADRAPSRGDDVAALLDLLIELPMFSLSSDIPGWETKPFEDNRHKALPIEQ
ncbi:hypothetical protein [Chromohalobacter nigrandesensis]|uniref:hypothetical protein n=1 Tax=Chromohalobacter nigrandesensis TaxID=119863 RepID=UPI001FF66F12|nr:hypothetical protein [Chromohalobacter nigrandesensis]MCK0746004.1 hypothetical protein [Chromohalobacter nigrandesensis]